MVSSDSSGRWLGYWGEQGIGWVAKRASNRTALLASALAEFAVRQEVSPESLADFLGCTPDRLAKLALCRRPDPNSPNFTSDIEKIASHCGADPVQLRLLLEASNSVLTQDEIRDLLEQLVPLPQGWGSPEYEVKIAASQPIKHLPLSECLTGVKAQSGQAGEPTQAESRGLRVRLRKLIQKIEQIYDSIKFLLI